MPAKTPGLLRHGPALRLIEHRHFGTYFREHLGRASNQSRSQCSNSRADAPAGSRQINAQDARTYRIAAEASTLCAS
jgi:hypothetical protein